MKKLRGRPVVVLTYHGERERLTSLAEACKRAGLGRMLVVDASGDHEYHRWLDDEGYEFTVAHPSVAPLAAEVEASALADAEGYLSTVLWREDGKRRGAMRSEVIAATSRWKTGGATATTHLMTGARA